MSGPLDFDSFGKQARQPQDSIIDPRDLFRTLPNKKAFLNYLRGPQDEVLKNWNERRTESDLLIKMDTGGGKTLVGLLIAKSLINEGEYPAAYLVPDDFLKQQVFQEAENLGLEVTDNPYDVEFQNGESILITTFAKVFNAKSIFGINGSSNKTRQIGLKSIIIDDAHSCISQAEQKFRLTLQRSDTSDEVKDAYNGILQLFEDDLNNQSAATLKDITSAAPGAMLEIPFWSWNDKQSKVLDLLHPLANTVFEWNWPLLVDCLPLCTAVITSDSIDIQPHCYPTDIVLGFSEANRRIYLTATLADESILIRHFGMKEASAAKPIFPSNAGDIGERMILLPQQIAPKITDDEIKSYVAEIARKQNVVVIVPSSKRAQWWDDVAKLIVDRHNIQDAIVNLKKDHAFGLVVLTNRYDGIDLANDECHFLVIDGIPMSTDATERLEQVQMGNTCHVLSRKIQRLEQGMGRATRSNNDHAVVILMGSALSNLLNSREARELLSPATRAQVEIADQIRRNLEANSMVDLNSVIMQCINRDQSWVRLSKGRTAELRYSEPTISKIAVLERQAFDEARISQFSKAASIQQKAVNTSGNPKEKGLLLQRTAAYTHRFNPANAQTIQLTAKKHNSRLTSPKEGTSYSKLTPGKDGQPIQASKNLASIYSTGNDLLIGMNELRDALSWDTPYDVFEQMVCNLAFHIGIEQQTPGPDTGRGPDVLWCFPDREFFVIEAKNEAKPNPVSKKMVSQLSNSMDWFETQYPNHSALPILIHPSNIITYEAAFPRGGRIISIPRLEKLKNAIDSFAQSLATEDAYKNPENVKQLINHFNFTRENFIKSYTEDFKQKR